MCLGQEACFHSLITWRSSCICLVRKAKRNDVKNPKVGRTEVGHFHPDGSNPSGPSARSGSPPEVRIFGPRYRARPGKRKTRGPRCCALSGKKRGRGYRAEKLLG